MNPLKIILFILAVINMVVIAVLIYKKKYNLAIGLGLLELLLIFSTNLLPDWKQQKINKKQKNKIK